MWALIRLYRGRIVMAGVLLLAAYTAYLYHQYDKSCQRIDALETQIAIQNATIDSLNLTNRHNEETARQFVLDRKTIMDKTTFTQPEIDAEFLNLEKRLQHSTGGIK